MLIGMNENLQVCTHYASLVFALCSRKETWIFWSLTRPTDLILALPRDAYNDGTEVALVLRIASSPCLIYELMSVFAKVYHYILFVIVLGFLQDLCIIFVCGFGAQNLHLYIFLSLEAIAVNDIRLYIFASYVHFVCH